MVGNAGRDLELHDLGKGVVGVRDQAGASFALADWVNNEFVRNSFW